MRKLMWFTVGFGIACAIGAYCFVPWLQALALLSFLLAGLCFALKKRILNLRIGCAVCLGIGVGLLFFWGYNGLILNSAREMDGKTQWVSIEVCDYSEPTNRGCSFEGKVELDGKSFRVWVHLDQYHRLEPGNRVRGAFRFQTTTYEQKTNFVQASKGYFLTAYQDGNCTPQLYWNVGWTHYPAIWRHDLKLLLHKCFEADTEAFACALLLGDRSEIDYETETALKVSGIIHIIAVSGLHISILFGCLYFISGKKRVVTMLVSVPVLLLFAAIAGFTPSITRACIMQILMILAMLCDKEYDPPTELAFSALVILIFNPLAIASVSFQLSFGCMIGIFLFCQKIRDWLMAPNRFGRIPHPVVRWLCSSVAVSISASVLTIPLCAIYFGCVSLIGVATNLLTLWIVTYIFYGLLLVCGIGFVSIPVSSGIAWVISWGIRYVVEAAKVMASLPFAAIYTKSIYMVLWLLVSYALLAVYLALRKKPAVLFASLILCGYCAAMALTWVEPVLNECRVTVLDVGQGQAILLQSEGKTFLVDCGGEYDEGAADTTAETLLAQGISKLDGVILSHYDRDHCGGLPYLLTRIDTHNLFLPYAEDTDSVAPTLQRLSDGDLTTVKEDIVLTYGKVKITIFAPLSYKSGNESSMCVLFQTENCDILITGDRNIQTEEMLLSRRQLPKLELLIAGHHGAENATGEKMLAMTQPEYVFISVGANNRYGHPSQEVLQRLAKYGCIVYCTDEYGTLIYKG